MADIERSTTSKTKSKYATRDAKEMEHTPNKQSKQDSYSLQNITDPTLESVSQEDDLDLETDKSSFESQFESQSFYQSSYTHSSMHSVTPCGDNFPSYQKPKTVQAVNASGDNLPTVTCIPSQLESILDLGYSSNSGCSSYQGQDRDSQRDNLTGDPGSQLDVPMSPSAAWSDDNCSENYLHGENELEDLLFHFQRFFEDRFESELNQFKESVHGMIQEQQSHVRQIVHRATCMREQSSQSSSDDPPEKTSMVIPTSKSVVIPQPQSEVVQRLLNGTLYIPGEELRNFSFTRQPQPSNDEKRTKLLDLLADSCSISTLLTKTEYR